MDRGDEGDPQEDVDFHFRDLVDVVFGYAATAASFEELRYFKQRMKQVLNQNRGETLLRSQHMYRPARGGRTRRSNGGT
jgi:hypothetical protein